VKAMVRILGAGALIVFVCAAGFAADVKETVHIVITGGPNAGTYDASTDRGGCSAGMAGLGSWGNQLSQPKEKDPKKFNSLQLIVPDAKKAASGTKEFFINVGFGPLMKRAAEYKVETRQREPHQLGSGTVTVMDHGTTGMVHFDVTTADKVHMVGTIDCKSVLRAQ
jgi:hypothetical protein